MPMKEEYREIAGKGTNLIVCYGDMQQVIEGKSNKTTMRPGKERIISSTELAEGVIIKVNGTKSNNIER